MKTINLIVFGWAVFFLSSNSFAQKTAVEIFKQLRPSVVQLANPEGHGTGFLISDSGLILTNAHVVASPLPFTCIVESVEGETVKSFTFNQVSILGFHPIRDLALAKIDPGEHPIKLVKAQIKNEKATPGQRVYAIGNPSSGDKVLDKTITSGLISGVDRLIDKVKYYQVDAAVNPGNSGGPLLDDFGNVIAVVTLKSHRNENVGFATPFYDLNHKDFVSVSEVKPNPEASNYFLEMAEEFVKRAEEEKNSLQEYFGQSYFQMMAAHHFHQALKFDPMNPTIYYKCGDALRRSGRYEIAESYLRFSIQISPWNFKDGRAYRSLGVALARQEKFHDALSVWQEGIQKYPTACEKCFEDIAVTKFNSQKYDEANSYAKLAKGFGSKRTKPSILRTIMNESEKNLTQEDTDKSNNLLNETKAQLEGWSKEADKAKADKKESLTTGFQAYLKSKGRFSRKTNAKIPEFDFSKKDSEN